MVKEKRTASGLTNWVYLYSRCPLQVSPLAMSGKGTVTEEEDAGHSHGQSTNRAFA